MLSEHPQLAERKKTDVVLLTFPSFLIISHDLWVKSEMFSQGTGLEADLPMLRVPEKVTNVGILMITGQRGRTLRAR